MSTIEQMETSARERNIGAMHPLNEHKQLFVQWHHVKKEFSYFTVDKRLTKPGVHNLDGFTDITRDEAIALL